MSDYITVDFDFKSQHDLSSLHDEIMSDPTQSWQCIFEQKSILHIRSYEIYVPHAQNPEREIYLFCERYDRFAQETKDFLSQYVEIIADIGYEGTSAASIPELPEAIRKAGEQRGLRFKTTFYPR